MILSAPECQEILNNRILKVDDDELHCQKTTEIYDNLKK